ncbi:MAG: histone deacetylase family protein [Alphaproteobacteria bacterium]|nr:histone deacetylase family protein [Alphaproteobacteria bacterium]
MTTLLFSHAAFAAHEVPAGHPENAQRYQAVEAALGGEDFAPLIRKPAPMATGEQIERIHKSSYRQALSEVAPAKGVLRLDPDTFIGPFTIEAASRAAGAACAAVDAVFAGEARNAFVSSRPPGHHALPGRAMGFCFFNAAAIAAMHARAVHGARRVAVVDFDVHHGNGTEAAFWNDENAFYASSHEHPQFPGTGRASDRGAFDNIANAPLETGTDGEGFRRAWGESLLPALSDFRPDFVVISAGFDAHRGDPVGGFFLTEEDFVWVTREIAAVARQACAGRLISVLEGGYRPAALASSVAAHVKALMAA